MSTSFVESYLSGLRGKPVTKTASPVEIYRASLQKAAGLVEASSPFETSPGPQVLPPMQTAPAPIPAPVAPAPAILPAAPAPAAVPNKIAAFVRSYRQGLRKTASLQPSFVEIYRDGLNKTANFQIGNPNGTPPAQKSLVGSTNLGGLTIGNPNGGVMATTPPKPTVLGGGPPDFPAGYKPPASPFATDGPPKPKSPAAPAFTIGNPNGIPQVPAGATRLGGGVTIGAPNGLAAAPKAPSTPAAPAPAAKAPAAPATPAPSAPIASATPSLSPSPIPSANPTDATSPETTNGLAGVGPTAPLAAGLNPEFASQVPPLSATDTAPTASMPPEVPALGVNSAPLASMPPAPASAPAAPGLNPEFASQVPPLGGIDTAPLASMPADAPAGPLGIDTAPLASMPPAAASPAPDQIAAFRKAHGAFNPNSPMDRWKMQELQNGNATASNQSYRQSLRPGLLARR